MENNTLSLFKPASCNQPAQTTMAFFFSSVLCYIFLGLPLSLECGVQEDKIQHEWKYEIEFKGGGKKQNGIRGDKQRGVENT